MTLLCDSPWAVPRCSKERLPDWGRAAAARSTKKRQQKKRFSAYIHKKSRVRLRTRTRYSLLRPFGPQLDPKKSKSVLEAQFEQKHPSIRPLPIAGREHQLLQRRDPKTTP